MTGGAEEGLGNTGEVLAFDPLVEEWQEAGILLEARDGHGVLEVWLDDLVGECVAAKTQ